MSTTSTKLAPKTLVRALHRFEGDSFGLVEDNNSDSLRVVEDDNSDKGGGCERPEIVGVAFVAANDKAVAIAVASSFSNFSKSEIVVTVNYVVEISSNNIAQGGEWDLKLKKD